MKTILTEKLLSLLVKDTNNMKVFLSLHLNLLNDYEHNYSEISHFFILVIKFLPQVILNRFAYFIMDPP